VRNTYILVGKPEVNTSLWSPRRKWEDSVIFKWILKKEGVNWIQMLNIVVFFWTKSIVQYTKMKI
jgi:hypothetical protein